MIPILTNGTTAVLVRRSVLAQAFTCLAFLAFSACQGGRTDSRSGTDFGEKKEGNSKEVLLGKRVSLQEASGATVFEKSKLEEECTVDVEKQGVVVARLKYSTSKRERVVQIIDLPDGKALVTKVLYNQDGKIETEILDENDDGTPEMIRKYYYSQDGRLISEKEDRDADGTVDLGIKYMYSPQNLLIEESYHDGSDGKVEKKVRYQYGPDRQVATKEMVDPGDGEVVKRTTYLYVDGRKKEDDIDYGANGTIDEKRVYTQLETPQRQMNVVSIRVEKGKEIPQIERRTVFDEKGRMVRDETYGDHNVRRTYFYNGDGGLTKSTEEYCFDPGCRQKNGKWVVSGEKRFQGICLIPLEEMKEEEME